MSDSVSVLLYKDMNVIISLCIDCVDFRLTKFVNNSTVKRVWKELLYWQSKRQTAQYNMSINYAL